MKLRGVSEDHASAALASLQQNEVVRARDVWARKFDSVPDDAKSWARQASFLQSRGFSADSIHKVLRERPNKMNENRMASQLKVERLRKKYKSRPVVKDVSFDVGSGEVVIGLLGPNGAGKTTCFYMIVGLVSADGGEIHLDGERLTHLPIHRRAHQGLSYLPQENSVFRKLDVEENILAILELNEKDSLVRARRLDELLDEMGIAHLRKSQAVSLSGGERRRVEIARALATSPRFILLDEPFAGVDPIAVIDIQKTIRFLKERGIGVLITDHNVRETLGICDRAYIINEGEVLASGRPDEIVYNESVRKVYLGEHFRL
jgi:lipopolysaccharide export system ATP-binding protein